MRKTLIITATLAACIACGNSGTTSKEAAASDSTALQSPSALGEWVKPIDGMDGEEGISIMADGKAASINRATLVYEAWTQNGDTLFVSGKSIGNGVTIETADTLLLQGDSLLHMASGEVVFKYGKRK